jgi:hypothetical protein
MAGKRIRALAGGAAALLLYVSSPAFAQVTISGHAGDVANGSTVTISGSGFSSRPGDQGSFFEDWEWGTAESSIDTLGSPWSTTGEDADPARFSDEFQRGGVSHRNLRIITPDRITGGYLNDVVYRQDFEVHPGDKVYISTYLWSTYAGATEFGPACPQQWKILNMLTHGPYFLGQPYTGLTWNAAGVDGPPDGDPQAWLVHSCAPGTAGQTAFSWGYQPPERSWWQVEIEYQVATAQSADDGFFRVWFNGHLAGQSATPCWCTSELNDAIVNDGYVYNTAVLRNFIQWSGCASRPDTIRHDDTCYQIGTWARVVLGNAPTWSACTVREYQPIVSWNPDLISITFNQGAFDTGETAWLYVVDNNGNRSGGHEVVIGGSSGSDTTSPQLSIADWFVSGVDRSSPNPFQITITGTASDNVGVQRVTWSSSLGGSGTATGTISWSIADIWVNSGVGETITIRAVDAAGNTTTGTLALDSQLPGAIPGGPPAAR